MSSPRISKNDYSKIALPQRQMIPVLIKKDIPHGRLSLLKPTGSFGT